MLQITAIIALILVTIYTIQTASQLNSLCARHNAQIYEILAANFMYNGFAHFAMCMITFTAVGTVTENIYGPKYFALILIIITAGKTIIYYILITITPIATWVINIDQSIGARELHYCCTGISGVVLALQAVITFPNRNFAQPWATAIIFSLTISAISFTDAAIGIVIGYICVAIFH